MGEAMAEDGLLHTAELLKNALPYVDIKSRLTLELLVKLYELIICMRNYRTNDISACGFENEDVDMEALLNSIRPKCNEEELSFVDKMLNIFQAKRMFEMYNTYMEAMKTMQGFEGFNNNDASSGFGENDDNGDGLAGFMNNFKDFDFSTIFGEDFNVESFSENLKSMTSDSTDENDDYISTDYGSDLPSIEKDSDESWNKSRVPNSDKENVTKVDNIPTNDSENNNYNTDNTHNSNMFENLKSMIPPEQLETFENLRMLFGSMSYDDNNKSDENG